MALFGWGRKRAKEAAEKADPRMLRDRAADAVRDSKHREALQAYAELARLQPVEADWPRRAAECHRILGESAAQIAALSRAAELYVASGFLVKGIASCKLILNKDGSQESWRYRMAPAVAITICFTHAASSSTYE